MKKWLVGIATIVMVILMGCSGPGFDRSNLDRSRDITTSYTLEGLPSINLYDGIGEKADEYAQFFDWIEAKGIKHFVMDIHTTGGTVFEIIYIANRMDRLKESGVIIETRVHGSAISGGFILFVNGTQGYRKTHRDAVFLLHGPQKYGKALDVRLPEYKTIHTSIVNILSNGLKVQPEIVREYVDKGKDHWFLGKEMLEKGWADEELE